MATAQERAQACNNHIRSLVSGEGRQGLRKRMSFPPDGALDSILRRGKGKLPRSEANWAVERDGDSLIVTGQPEILAIVSDLVKDLNTSSSPDGAIIIPLLKA